MSSSSASSPSLNKHFAGNSTRDDVAPAAAAARFNPLYSQAASSSTRVDNLHNYRYNCTNLLSQSSVSRKHSQSIDSSIFRTPTTEDHDRARHENVAVSVSPGPKMQGTGPAAAPSRKLQVFYYLSRSGHLEHPHLLEVSVLPNQGLHLRDVKRRLAVIRGKRLPSTFAWSYKRSYKNGYVWQDLCDDDLIFPAHGCEYVLKGSEILTEQRSIASEEENAEAILGDTQAVVQSDGAKGDRILTCRGSKLIYRNEPACAVLGHPSMHVSMVVQNGTDAATQTEEETKHPSDSDSNDHNPCSKCLNNEHEGIMLTKHSTFSQGGSYTRPMPQKAIELSKAEIASPPFASSATDSPSPYNETASATSSSNSVGDCSTDQSKHVPDLIKSGSKTPGRPWMIKAIQELEEQDVAPRVHVHSNGEESSANGFSAINDSASRKFRYRSMPDNSIALVNMDEAQHLSAANMNRSRGKQSSAVSLLQFMSCGGLDIKEQILPMSLYDLRSRGTPGSVNQLVMSNYVLSPDQSRVESIVACGSSDCDKTCTAAGNLKSSSPDGPPSVSKPIGELGGEFVNVEPCTPNSHGHCQCAQPIQGNSLLPVSVDGSTATVLGVSVPDVISIARSSMSDRSTNASHEQASNVIAMLKKSGEVPKHGHDLCEGSSNLATDSQPAISSDQCRNAARAVSGEILMNKASPLFVPGKIALSYSGTPLNCGTKPFSQSQIDRGNNAMLMRQDAHNRDLLSCSSSWNPSRAFSDGEVSCMLSNRNAWNKSRGQISRSAFNGYDQSMAQLWEELLAAPSAVYEEHQPKSGECPRARQLAMGGSSTWEVERTLQNAVELSLQPPLDHHLLNVDSPHFGRKMKSSGFAQVQRLLRGPLPSPYRSSPPPPAKDEKTKKPFLCNSDFFT